MENKTSIWIKLLQIVAWIVLLSGVFYGLIVPYFMPGLLDMYLNEFNSKVLFNDIANGPKTMIQFLFGILGGIMIGWGTLLMGYTISLYVS
jgi:hypothetical protein